MMERRPSIGNYGPARSNRNLRWLCERSDKRPAKFNNKTRTSHKNCSTENVADRRLDTYTKLECSSGVSAKFWFMYLKQQCRKDARAFDITCNYETTHASEIRGNTSNAEYLEVDDNCLTCHTTQRGVPKEQQIHQLYRIYINKYSESQMK